MSIVGMDLHVRNSFLEATDRRGRPLRRGRVENTLASLAEFLGLLEGAGEPIRVVLENTANSRAMKLLLERYGREAGVDLKAQVLDARKLRVIAASVNKCDKVDAAILCELARSKLKLPTVYVPEDEVFWLREHLRARADLVLIRTALKLRAHALLHRRGLWPPDRGGLFTKAGRAWLSQVELDDAGREILDRFLAQLDAIEESLKQSESTLRRLSTSDRWRRASRWGDRGRGSRTNHVGGRLDDVEKEAALPLRVRRPRQHRAWATDRSAAGSFVRGRRSERRRLRFGQ